MALQSLCPSPASPMVRILGASWPNVGCDGSKLDPRDVIEGECDHDHYRFHLMDLADPNAADVRDAMCRTLRRLASSYGAALAWEEEVLALRAIWDSEADSRPECDDPDEEVVADWDKV